MDSHAGLFEFVPADVWGMRTLVSWSFVLSATLILCLVLAVLFSKGHDSAGERTALLVCERMQLQRAGSFEIPNTKQAHASNVLGFLPGPEVTRIFIAGRAEVYYSQWPFGPTKTLNCADSTWTFGS